MNLIFAGTPEFARTALESLVAAGHRIVLVLTQPDRPAGRGMKLQASAVKQLALAHGVPIAQAVNTIWSGRNMVRPDAQFAVGPFVRLRASRFCTGVVGSASRSMSPTIRRRPGGCGRRCPDQELRIVP